MTFKLLIIFSFLSFISCVFNGKGSIYFTYSNQYNSGVRVIYRPQNYQQYSSAGGGFYAIIGFNGYSTLAQARENYAQQVVRKPSSWVAMTWNDQGKYYYYDTALTNIIPGYWMMFIVSIFNNSYPAIYLDSYQEIRIPWTVSYCQLDSSRSCGCGYSYCSSFLPSVPGTATPTPYRNNSYRRTTASWNGRKPTDYPRGRHTTLDYGKSDGHDGKSSAKQDTSGALIAGIVTPILLIIIIIIIIIAVICVKKGCCKKPQFVPPSIQFRNRQTPAPAQPPPANPVPLNNISQNISPQYPSSYPPQNYPEQPPLYGAAVSDPPQQPQQTGFNQMPPNVPSAPPAMPPLQPPEYQPSSSGQYPYTSAPGNHQVNVSQKIGHLDYNTSGAVGKNSEDFQKFGEHMKSKY